MLGTVFLQILNMSFTASFVILAVIVARLLLKKAPHVISYALWAVVLFRLVCPFSFESAISLLPVRTNPIPQEIMYQQTPQINTGIPMINDSVNAVLPAATPQNSMNPMQGIVAIGTFFWLCGIVALVIYSVISLLMLKWKLRGAICEGGNIYLAEGLPSPFVMGLFRPKIYLPTSLTDGERQYILLHEQTHIIRFDHVVKMISFFVLCLHWFNPLVWVAFFFSGRDMELSCDEAVIKKLGSEVKKDYSSSLLTLATGRRIVGGYPLAFGEGDTKSRIKNVLNYKKPAFWVTVISVLVVGAVGIGLLANPTKISLTMNSLHTPALTLARQAELTQQYELATDSTMFQTQIRVDDNIKSYRYYVELYQRGEMMGTFADSYGNFIDKNGAITTAYDVNRGADGRWASFKLAYSFLDGGYATYPNIPFPDGFAPSGVATTTIANTKNSAPAKITPEEPIIIGSVAFQMEDSRISAYDCEYLMERPEAIAQYECVYLVKCVFSEKDETELAQMITSGAFAPPNEYLTTFELCNGMGEILQSSFSLLPQTATELPALLLKGTDKTTPSVNDVPQDTEEYLKITIGELPDRTYFVYKSKEKYWVEHPYDYKRELEEETYVALMEYLQTMPSSPKGENKTPANLSTDAETTMTAPIVNSYYAGQNSRVFKMLQKSIFQNWVEYDNNGLLQNLVNPKWDFDRFTKYTILDANMNVVPGKDLYYCTFSDDNGRNGYIVVAYHGDNLEKISKVETQHPYDLRANIEDITAKLAETDVDLATAVAARVQIVDAEQSSAREAILITDGNKNQYLYYFDEPDAAA